jgi:Fic family protein
MPIDAAEFDAHRDLASVIAQFLCRNKDKGFSAKEIAQATGIPENDVNSAMLKLGISDIASAISGKRREFKIEDVTINGVIYYRCAG